MLQLTVLAIICSLAKAQNHIDPNDCVERRGDYGVTVQCPAGYAGTALCSSGRNADCQGSYTILRCCKVISAKNIDFCEQLNGGYGDYLECDSAQVVTSVCTSGRNGDCGADAYTRIQCCDDLGLDVTTSCTWPHGHYGVTVECGIDHVITGACTSGINDDCSNEYTGIKCCYVQ